MQPGTGRSSQTPVDPDDVRALLADVLASKPFEGSPQLAAFLTFVVEETLAGRGGDLKGYTIATQALGRSADFDPQSDPIVRVQAGRLRQALSEYQAMSPGERMTIVLPKGSYTPVFVTGPAASFADDAYVLAEPVTEAPSGPGPAKSGNGTATLRLVLAGLAGLLLVAVMVFSLWPSQRPQQSTALPAILPTIQIEADTQGVQPQLDRLVQRLSNAIARFDDIVVVREATASTAPAQPAATFSLRIRAQGPGDNPTSYGLRLVSSTSTQVLWSADFERAGGAQDDDGAIVSAVASRLAQPYGIVQALMRQGRGAMVSSAGVGTEDCGIAVFDYWIQSSVAEHARVRSCLTAKIAQSPNLSSAHAQLAFMHLEEFRQGYNPLAGDPLDRALQSARTAVRLAPTSARAHQALLAAHFARREMDQAWRAAEEALRLNPYDTEIQEDVGARHIQSGSFEKGLAKIDRALVHNVAPPTWVITFRALGLYMLGRLDESGPIALQLSGTEYAPAMIAAFLGAFQFKDVAKAREAMAALMRHHPEIGADPGPYLQRLNFAPVLRERILDDFSRGRQWLKSAGKP